jgi:hypothetical protein
LVYVAEIEPACAAVIGNANGDFAPEAYRRPKTEFLSIPTAFDLLLKKNENTLNPPSFATSFVQVEPCVISYAEFERSCLRNEGQHGTG